MPMHPTVLTESLDLFGNIEINSSINDAAAATDLLVILKRRCTGET
jgi:hypothetical protein